MNHWPHGPARMATGSGLYMVTAATVGKAKIFDTAEKLDLLEQMVLGTFAEANFSVEAWAVFPNHYHVVGAASNEGVDLTRVLRKLHANSAREVNRLDQVQARKVGFSIGIRI